MRAIIITLLVVGIFGAIGYFGYELVWKKKVEAERELARARAEAAAAAAATPTPEPGLEQLERGLARLADGELGEAHIALTGFIREHPDSSRIQEAIDALGKANADLLFSGAKTPGKVEYEVVPGDTLSGIAGEHGTTAELIMKVNGLDSTMLHVGDRLLVPSAGFELRINRGAQLVDLYRDGVFFKRYRPLAFEIPPGGHEGTVSDKIAWRDGERVAFGTAEYLGSTRWVRLDAGFPLYELPRDGETVHVAPPVEGIQLTSEEMRELFAIVRHDTPVVIHHTVMNVAPLDFEQPIVELEKKLDELRKHVKSQDIDLDPEVLRMTEKIAETRSRIYRNLSAWQRVQISRHSARPFMLDYVANCFGEFIELHGDRQFGDDRSMPGGLATIGRHKCVVVGQQKGRDTKENILRNFGCAHPEGYRKALRKMKLAEKFKLPVVTLVDTPGAYPGIGAEERHISEAIAVNLREMMTLEVPIVAVVIGEGGSGGALGIGVADRVLILENAYYSVISPEGCAAILWKHRKHAPEAAEALRLTAPDLEELGLVEEVVKEPEGGAHHDHKAACEALRQAVVAHLDELGKLSKSKLLDQRYAKFRQIGEFIS